jgi:hypothetical protein
MSRTAVPLTDALIRRTNPAAKMVKLFDGLGLYLDGRSVNACEDKQYKGLKPKFTVKDGFGLKASVSGGGQLTIAGGGQASGGCSCGG